MNIINSGFATMARLASFSLPKWKFIGVVTLLLALVSVVTCTTYENIIEKHATRRFSVKEDSRSGIGTDRDVKSHVTSGIDVRDVNLTDGVDLKGDKVDEDITRRLGVRSKGQNERGPMMMCPKMKMLRMMCMTMQPWTMKPRMVMTMKPRRPKTMKPRTMRPTMTPSTSPSFSFSPSSSPSSTPSSSPSSAPSASNNPSKSPSRIPSVYPSRKPSKIPSTSPSGKPSISTVPSTSRTPTR